MNAEPLFPREPRKMLQPTKAQMRAQLAAAADTIASLRAESERLQRNPCVRLAAFLRGLRSTGNPTGETP